MAETWSTLLYWLFTGLTFLFALVVIPGAVIAVIVILIRGLVRRFSRRHGRASGER